MRHSMTVEVPAYNQAQSLETMLPPLIACCQPRGWKIIVVNDGSSDDTRHVLERHQADSVMVYHHEVNHGCDGALKTGLAGADTEFVVTIDADGQHRLSDIDALLAALLEADADMVVGKRQQQYVN